MKTAVEKLNPTLAKIEVEVPFAEFKPYLDRTYKNLSGQISVPGFRKGKLPKQLIEQRAGFDYIVEASLNDALNDYYAQALGENELSPLAQPELDVQSQPSTENREADVKLTITVTVRPEIELPNYEGLEVEVDEVEVTAEDEVQALDALRERFGTLKTVERPAADKDFVTIDIAAEIDGEQVDAANDLSYQIGSGTMLDGIDEALTGLSAGEDATFETKLSGGEHAGEQAVIKVKLTAVKERELPAADDEFAQLASEFDTIDELKEDIKKQVAEAKVAEQGTQARDKVLAKLVELVEIPVPEKVIEDQLEQHFNNPNAEADHDTEEHRAEVRENTETAFKNEMVLDAVADKEEVTVDQAEMINYIITMSSQYGMDPNQFAQMLDGSGQAGALVGEVRRSKALAAVLKTAVVKDTKGNVVDLSKYLGEGEEAAA
ncbi:trigger factor [Rothia sp. HMSC072B04]|uniref:trigger factor n=1 Tax=unclassified Rothia (in: high G+C Gram-positive bacteria) TaxID=2689056 RepID=UPI0008A36FE5|nr:MULTISPECIES: trigger factor [unclassified Rothia (in: high G+C Gram-positive bacteria)]MBF1668822.1 trigger factor [Rothia sp. (in: high G+C Gram-positive bacteria)]OFJ96746.1 trigger factor [Rothia sp. HMSC065C12]OFN74944.1 trigger factor [Rothia sp. HMSC071B01]OFQ59184.1 trigger factor [Rothia sp. HMSC072B04]OFR45494.1 trigger factor [Rothia sp. HMSC073B08]